MFKKLTLDSSIYKKFFSLSDEVMEKMISGDIDYILASERVKKLIENATRTGNHQDEIHGRIVHFLLFDYAHGYINKIQDASLEASILRTNKIGVFEIMEKNKDHLIYLDISSGESYTIVGEGMGSERKLAEFHISDIVISRLIQLDDGWYNMKNYYIISSDDIDLQNTYKPLFHDIKDLYDVEERFALLCQSDQINNKEEINYEKRIKKILGKNLTNKLEKELNKLFKNVSEKTFFEFQEFLSKISGVKSEDISTINRYITSFINSEFNINTSGYEISGKEAKKLIQQDNDKIIIDYLTSEIRDFSLDELLEKIRKESNTSISDYEIENRYINRYNGWKAHKMHILFEHIWQTHRKDDEYIFEDIEGIYNDILIIREDDNHVWNLRKIDEFGNMLTTLLSISTQKNLLEEFIACIEVYDFIEPEYILENISDPLYREKFRKSIETIGYEWGEWDE